MSRGRSPLFEPERLAANALPLAFFTLFLVVPLLSLAAEPIAGALRGYYDFTSLLDYPFVNRRPLGEFIIYRDVPGGPDRLIVSFKDLGVIPNTFVASTIVALAATVIGTLVALVVARYRFPGRDAVRILAMMPIIYTPFVNAFVAYKLFGDDGILAAITGSLLGVEVVFQGLAGVILAQILMFWPIVYINAFSSMAQIDPSLEEQAENLGSRGFRLYRTITLPLAMPGIASGAALVFIFSMEDLAAPIAFRVDNVMSRWIVNEILAAADVGEITAETVTLTLIMLLTATIWFVATKHYISLRQYAMLQKGGRRSSLLRRPSPLLLAAIYLLLVPLVLVSIMPQIGVLVYAFSERWTGVVPEGFTLDHFRDVLSDDRVVRSFRNSVVYSLTASAIILVVAVTSSYAVERLRTSLSGALDVLATLPLAVPGLALAMGFLVLFAFGGLQGTPLDPFINPWIYLVIAYSVRKSPFTTRAAFAGLKHLHPSLEEAAMNLGATRLRVLRDVTIPIIGLNLLGGLLVSFVYSVTEVSTSITIGGLNEDQSPITFIVYDYVTGGYGGGAFIHLAAAIVSLIMALQVIAIVTVNIVFKQRFAFIGV